MTRVNASMGTSWTVTGESLLTQNGLTSCVSYPIHLSFLKKACSCRRQLILNAMKRATVEYHSLSFLLLFFLFLHVFPRMISLFLFWSFFIPIPEAITAGLVVHGGIFFPLTERIGSTRWSFEWQAVYFFFWDDWLHKVFYSITSCGFDWPDLCWETSVSKLTLV